jgi:hypothetical protein
MSLTSYRAAPPRGIRYFAFGKISVLDCGGSPDSFVLPVLEGLAFCGSAGLLHLRNTAAFYLFSGLYFTEAKRPLEGGPLFRLSRSSKRR